MIKVFDMFAGYGSSVFALKRIGIDFEVVGYSENDKTAIRVYNKNHPNIKNYGDATKIKPEELPDFDLLTAGFPCQAFSVAGKRKGFEDSRGTLFNEIIRIIKVKKPKYLLLENVKGLVTHDNGNTLRVIETEIRKSGYDIQKKILNSKNFGIPQNRERIWLVCKLGQWEFLEFTWPKEIPLKITVRDLLTLTSNRKEIKNKRINLILKHYTGRENLLFELHGKDETGKPKEGVPPSGLSRQCDRIYSLKYSPCLNCTQREYLFFDDGKIITITPEEACHLMGLYPHELNLLDLNDDQKFKLIGNGWDVNVASKILKNIFKNYYLNQKKDNIPPEEIKLNKSQLTFK